MADPSAPPELPDGYVREEHPEGVLVVLRSAAAELCEAGFGLQSDGRLELSGLVGRRPMPELRVPGGACVLRRFSHGGLARALTGRRFLRRDRPFRELALSEALRRAGVPTPQVVAARARRAPGFGWHLDLLTRRVEGTLDLGFVLAGARAGEVPLADLRCALRAAGRVVERLHAAGCEHADLSPNNVLVGTETAADGAPDAWILDLDRSRLGGRLSDAARRRNLARFARHVARRERERGAVLTRTDYLRFLRGYDPDGERWKADWRGVVRRHRWARLLHAPGWMLERAFARQPDPRAAPATPGRSA